MSRRPIPHRAWLAATVLVLVCMSMLPARYGEWVNGVGGLATRLIAPASHPISSLARWVVPASRTSSDDPLVAALEQQREEFRTLWLREQEETSRLRRLVAELQRGAMYPELQLHQLARPVFGSPSDGLGGVLFVRAGTREGIEKNVVAVTAGVQLVGRVIESDSLVSHVRLINNQRTRERIRGVLMTNDDQRGAICLLTPLKDGTLQGQVETSDTPAEVGQLVRLDDEEWPRHAQALIIGRIEHVEKGLHGWQFIRVRPTVDLDRVKEVVLRFTPPHEVDAAGPAIGGAAGRGEYR